MLDYRWMTNKRRGLGACCLLLLLVALTACQGNPPPKGSIAQVQQINSGHSIEVTLQGPESNTLRRVRLLGIVAPDLGQLPWGAEAKRYLSQKLQNQAVLLEFDEEQQDSLKRLGAYLWLNDRLLNEELVAQGFVLAESHLPNVRYETRLRRAQESARLQGLGIWNPDRPLRQHPEQYRKLKLGAQASPTAPIAPEPIAPDPTPPSPGLSPSGTAPPRLPQSVSSPVAPSPAAPKAPNIAVPRPIEPLTPTR
jgi:micrococcal nuclease